MKDFFATWAPHFGSGIMASVTQGFLSMNHLNTEFSMREISRLAPYRGKLGAAMMAFNASVRPGLAWAFGMSIIVMTICQIPIPDAYWGLAGSVIAWFLTSRDAEQAQERSAEQQRELVELARALPPDTK
jgi:hypothetical protein